jgi:hypothetical protein
VLSAGPVVRHEWMQCAHRLLGSGMPPGVTILRMGPEPGPANGLLNRPA